MADDKGSNSSAGGERPVFSSAIFFKPSRTGISREESTSIYNDWASAGTYDEEMNDEKYLGPKAACDAVAEMFPTDRDNVFVLDLACGTGFVGKKLQQQGFRKIQGLDPSLKMLETARQKNAYEKLYTGYLDSSPLPMDADTYDCAIISGGLCEGHVPTSGLRSMARVVKSGGVMVIVMRESFLREVTEFNGRLEKEMEEMEKEGVWRQESRKLVPNYFHHHTGVVFIFRKS